MYNDEGLASKIYDTNLKVVKSFVINPEVSPVKIKIEQRKEFKEVTTYNRVDSYNIVHYYEELNNITVNENNITIGMLVEIWKYLYSVGGDYLSNPDYYTLQSSTGSTAYYIPTDTAHYYHYSEYGTKYPYQAIKLDTKNGPKFMTTYEYDYYESIQYTGEWETIKDDETETRVSEIQGATIFDADNSTSAFSYLSQTLFNDDEKFEYLIPAYDEEFKLYYTRDRDDDGEVDYREYRTCYTQKGFNLYSDGVKIGYLNAPLADISRIAVFGGNTYIMGEYYDENDEYYYEVVYRVNKSANSIEQVGEPVRAKMSVREDIVTIDFKEPTKEECELIVTTTDGRMCKKESIAAGSENIKYNTRDFAKGIYNFSVMQKGKVVENGKIIIR